MRRSSGSLDAGGRFQVRPPTRLAPAVIAIALIALALAVVGCKSRRERDAEAPAVPVAVAPEEREQVAATTEPWPELAGLPRAAPLRVITLPARSDVPRFDVGGPALVGDLAVVASSQFGFAAVDWRQGTLAWTKPAGSRVAPPLARGRSFVLIGACVAPPAVPDRNTLLACLRIVAADGTDEAYLAIHGTADVVEPFAGSAGVQQVWLDGEHAVRWRRGDHAVTVDLDSGVATPAHLAPPPVVVTYQGRRWDLEQEAGGRILARQGGRVAWSTDHTDGAMLGAVYLPGQAPHVRVATIGSIAGTPELRLHDLDATGSMHGAVAVNGVPAISLLGQAISPVGDVALALRMDNSIKRDYIAAYAANGILIYVYPLPMVMRADPVGVAIALDHDRAPEVVIAFHDGDLVTVLPSLSSPPTAPGAARGPLENTTP